MHASRILALLLVFLAAGCDPAPVEPDAARRLPDGGAPTDDAGPIVPPPADGGGEEDAGRGEDGGPATPPDAGPPRPPPEAGDPSFAHATIGALDGACESANPFGFSLGDWNRDGHVDLQSWSHSRTTHCMWTGDGDGTFTVASGWTAETAPFFTGGWNVQLADLDGDGDLDAIGRTTEGEDGWIENTTSRVGGVPRAVFHHGPWGNRAALTVADFDGDGALEVAHEGPVLYRLDGSVLATLDSVDSAIVFDWTGDSYPDLVVPDGPSWESNGDGTFRAGSVGPAFAGCSGSRSLVFDADLDGDVDVLCYTGDDDLWIVVQEAGGSFRRHPLTVPFDVVNTVATKAAHSVADYNNDGHVDVLIMGRGPGSTNLLLNRGGLVFERADNARTFDVSIDGNHHGSRPTTAPHDYDGDGRVDFVGYDLRDEIPGAELMLWRNTTPEAGHYVQVVLSAEAMGAGRNRDALGAVVEALAPGTSTRVGSSYRTVRSYQQGIPTVAHLGTDTHETVDLRVTWPSGHGTETFTGVRADRRYVVRYAPSGSRLEEWELPRGE